MRPLVYLEIFRPREHFPAAGERAWEGFLSRVHSDVIDELVLRFERPSIPRTALPETGVRRALGASDVLDG